jgi:transcriptional regulator with XRE-family HTH domain
MSDQDSPTLNIYKKRLAHNLRTLLEIQAFSLVDLSVKLNISYGTLYNIVNNSNANPTFDTLYAIALFFNISISQLLGEFPIINNKNLTHISLAPILELEEVIEFINDDTLTKFSDKNKVFIPSNHNLSNKVFVLKASPKTEPLFSGNTLMVFDLPSAELKNYDQRLVLISVESMTPTLKKLIIDGKDIFLQHINTSLPIQKFDNDTKMLAILIEARINYND